MTYKDVPILKYQEIHAAIAINPDEPERQWYNILPLFTPHPKEYWQNMKYKDFKKECERYYWIADAPLPDGWVKEFECQGETFKIVQHATDWTTEQFISMSNLTKNKEDIVNNLHIIIAVLTEGGSTQKEIDRRATLFQNHLSVEIAYPVGFFFAAFLAKLSLSTQYSLWLKKKMMNIKKQGKMSNGFMLSGGGMRSLTNYLRRVTGRSLIIIFVCLSLNF